MAIKLLPAIRMDARERKILNDNLKGELVPYEGATKGLDITGYHLLYDQWDDLRFPAESTKLGSNSKPDYDYTNNGLLFPQNNTSEVIYIVAQIPHTYMYGTDLKPHIHYIQTGATIPVFKLKYRWY